MGNNSTRGSSWSRTEEQPEPTDEPAQTDVTTFSDSDEVSTNQSGPVGPGAGAGAIAGSSSLVGQEQGEHDEEHPVNDEVPDEEFHDNESDEGEQPEKDVDEDEDDEEEDDTVTITQVVDPLSFVSFDMQPVMKRVAENYDEQVDIEFVPAPVREIPEEPPAARNGMPLDPSVWSDLPETTEMATRAWIAAMRQGCGDEYLRRTWITVFAEGIAPDQTTLRTTAEDLDLDVKQFDADMDDVDLPTGACPELPVTNVATDVPAPKTGPLRYAELRVLLATRGVAATARRSVDEFVAEHQPVATAEVREVYEHPTLEEAVAALEQAEGVSRQHIGIGTFWRRS
ncbi:DsbA family protein [Halomarina ordinaria]|uniref:DsbA family protein n=1 Tax=Halomarina ordinaria TaxID=3033939 RepID=A0ABD5U582_9EURY|nr:DsbA family protein [Halomarina sp. PSRA2]